MGQIWNNTKAILLLGFGCLLSLMAILGVEAYRRSISIYRDETAIHKAFQRRAAVLDGIQSDIHRSGIRVRDYLLDPTPASAPEHRRRMQEVRKQLEDRVSLLEKLASPRDRDALAQLRHELEIYWKTLEPVFEWEPERKASLSFPFLSREVLPRRNLILQIAGTIDQLNEISMAEQQEKINANWSSYRKFIVWMFTYSLGLALLTAVVTFQRLSRLERRSKQQRVELANAEQRLRLLSQQLVRAHEEERKSISRELHDQIGQMLTGIRMIFGNIEHLYSGADGSFAEQLSEGKSLAEKTLQMVRNLALGLRPSMLDDLGLGPALEWQTREFARLSGIPVDLKVDGRLDGVPEDGRTCVFRVVQESLTNCARHAQAKAVKIDVHGSGDALSVTVADDGVGFDAGLPSARGLGLVGIEERVRELGGTIEILSQPGMGTTLRALIPVKEKPSS